MVLQRADSIVRTMLSDTILALCRNTLSYEGEVCIEGLLGITVDQKEVFLVHLNETIQKEGFSPTKSLKRKTVDVPSKESGDDSQQSSQGSESESQDFSQTPTKRKRRRKRRSKDKPNFDKDGIEGNLDAYSDKLDISQEQKPCDIENDDADSHLSAEVKKEDSHSGEEELVFVKEEPSDVYEQSVFSLPGASQPAESSQLYQQNDPVPIGQLQELAFQLSGDISQTQHNIPQTPALSSQSAGGTTEQGAGGDVVMPGHFGREGKFGQSKKLHQCEICFKSFDYQSRLMYHMWTHTGYTPFKCDTCGRTFRDPSDLKIHKRRHTGERPFKCPICSDAFVSKQVLNCHIKKHCGSKPYTCPLCGKEYLQMGHLNQHLKSHSDERPHVCEICGKGFKSKSSLHCHGRVHTGERPHKCEICGRAFGHKPHLTSHLATHSGEMPFQCDICERKFRSQKNLMDHQRYHTGEKPFQCHICGRGFVEAYILNSHVRTHTGEKPFTCDLCGDNFAHSGTLCNHKRLVHKVGRSDKITELNEENNA